MTAVKLRVVRAPRKRTPTPQTPEELRAALWKIAQALGMSVPLPNVPDVVEVVVRYAQETREALDVLRRGTR